MSFFSFPANDRAEPEQHRSVYGKVFSAATQMLQSLRADDDDGAPTAQTGAPPAPPSQPALSPQPSVSSTPDQPQLHLSGPPTPVASPDRPPLLRTSTLSSATVGLSSEQAVPLLPTTVPSSVSTGSDHVVSRRSDSFSRSASFARAGSRAGSHGGIAVAQRDGESLMSISSSASRAYLASQYNRGRSRVLPGKLSREFWMKDESAATCFGCNSQFTTFRRKHHCRVCGQIFCSACTRLIDGERFGARGRRIRCCTACEDALDTHSSSDDEDISFSVSHVPPTPGYDSEGQDSLPTTEESEHTAYSRVGSPMTAGKDEMHFARSFLGASHHHSAKHSHSRAKSYSQQKREEDSVVRRKRSSSTGTVLGTPASTPATLNPANLAAASPAALPNPGATVHGTGHGIGHGTTGTTGHGAVNGTASPVLIPQTMPSPLHDPPASQVAAPPAAGASAALVFSHSPSSIASSAPPADDYPQSAAHFLPSAAGDLNSASLTYLSLFLDQLLRDSELVVEDWNQILTPPILQAAAGLHLELNNSTSPREWVKIKRIPGGKPENIETICGSVFTHSLARTSMTAKIRTPRILLIAFPIEYARPDRYMSLEPVLAQEKEYLRKLVARIMGLQPTLLLTCSHICGQALDILESSGVAVAQNVRESALFHLSQIVKADILASIDRLSAAPRLGSCELFEVRAYRYENLVKSYMFFLVKPSDPGRCVLVRGDPDIGRIVKVVMEVMTEVCYNLKAETSLMRDQFALIPPLTNPPAQILSSSPFVDYGAPFLQSQAHILEDSVVELGNELDSAKAPDQQYILASRLDAAQRRWMDASIQWENVERANPYMFNPSSHQNLVVLYSLNCSETQTPCVGPDQMLIEFYLDTDQTLGQTVENSILQVRDPCPDDCEHNMEGHHKLYVNGTGCVTIHTEKSPCKLPGLQDSILMWSYCKKCDQQMPVLPMSPTTWKYSMGKYLELSFYGEPLKMRASSCEHNIYRDHVRYFGWHDYALRVEYSQVVMNEISGPPKAMFWDPVAETQLKKRVYVELKTALERFWDSLVDCLSRVTVEGLEEATLAQSNLRLEQLRTKAAEDRVNSLEMLAHLNEETEENDYLSLNGVLEPYQHLVDSYLAEFAEFDGQFFPTERDIRRVTAQHIRGLLGDDPEKPRTSRRSSASSDNPVLKQSDLPAQLDASTRSIKTESDEASQAAHAQEVPASAAASPDSNILPPATESQTAVEGEDEPPGSRLIPIPHESRHQANLSPGGASSINVTPVIAETLDSALNRTPNDHTRASTSIEPHTPPTSGIEQDSIQRSPSIRLKSRYGNSINVSMPGIARSSIREGAGRVSMLARHFEELSREFERERQREQQRLKDRQKSMALKQAQPVAEVFEDVSETFEDWPQHSRSGSKSALASDLSKDPSISVPYDTAEYDADHESGGKKRASVEEFAPPAPATESILDDIASTSNTSGEAAGPHQDSSNIPSHSNDVASLRNSSGSTTEDDDLKKAEPIRLSLVRALTNFWAERSSTRWNGIEYLLGPGEHFFSNSPVVLRESEPSSLIAFCLSLPDYVERVADFYSNTPGIASDQASETDDDVSLEMAMLRRTGTHMRYHFDQNNARVSCKIFFSEQFDALRRKCKCSDRFIQSLSRCNTWDSAGGKSGSVFLKTLDERLILKELSHAEFDSFVQFAPSYFEYMAQALFHDLPTVLAKVFGVYQIIIRNTQSSQQIKMYVLVMENLFYGGKFSKFFDLKGSMRNRKVTETGKANEVLLDENMVEYIYEKPVFVREHSKHMLRSSLYNDTLFLTKMNVMDYSLVIGLDEDNKTIVAGIIDYIRTYTWDKKIESWVKGKASTGVKVPTVVSPKQYKVRFRESMERYFVMVPDCWSQPIV